MGRGPGRVFDFETDLDGIAEASAALDERRAVKSLVWVPLFAPPPLPQTPCPRPPDLLLVPRTDLDCLADDACA